MNEIDAIAIILNPKWDRLGDSMVRQAARTQYSRIRAENERMKKALTKIAMGNLYTEPQIEWQIAARDALSSDAENHHPQP